MRERGRGISLFTIYIKRYDFIYIKLLSNHQLFNMAAMMCQTVLSTKYKTVSN